MSHSCGVVVFFVAYSLSVVEESPKMSPRDPFDRFIQNELFNSNRQPTCANIHPLIDGLLESMEDGDLESLDAFQRQFASCLPKALFAMGQLNITPIMIGLDDDEGEGDSGGEEDLLFALRPDDLFVLLEMCIKTAQFLEPVVRHLFNRLPGDDGADDTGEDSAIAS